MPQIITVLYEDDQIVVFDKPCGFLVTPSPGKTKKVLTEIVNAQYMAGSECRLHPCHRLDEMTSGAIIYAKGKRSQKIVMDMFHQGRVEKVYVAFVKGRVKQSSGVIRRPVRDHYQKRFAAASRAKSAVTRYRVVDRGKGFTVVEARPETGRTNQIRIHFAETGHPILGERVYAFRKDFDVDMKRLALHCQSLGFVHPVTEKTISVASQMPGDMMDFLKRNA